MQQPIPLRFYSLDVIRGLAAFCVVFWHWQHFFYTGTQWVPFSAMDQPFYSVFFLLYQKGWMAVDFFFSLSGFIFFWLYADAIGDRRVGPWTFFVLRFSRLYPLHIATFVFVLLGQYLLRARTGDFFVYPFNDAYHGLLNLFMASNWGLEKGWAFNAPVWSVSVEVLLYALFFAMCLLLRMRLWLVLALVAAGLLLCEFYPLLGRGLFSFFIGGLTYRIYQRLQLGRAMPYWLVGVAIASALLWIAVVLEVRNAWFWPRCVEALAEAFGQDVPFSLPELQRRGALFVVTGVLFPMTILTLALAETWRGHLGRRLALIGNLSYSSYLLHFPLQLTLVGLAGVVGIDRTFFYSAASILLFFALLIPLCLLSYRCLECPAQVALRTRLLRRTEADGGRAFS